jgi:hypothetical protein
LDFRLDPQAASAAVPDASQASPASAPPLLSEEQPPESLSLERIRRTQEQVRESIREAGVLIEKTQELIERLREMREAGQRRRAGQDEKDEDARSA